MTISLRVNLPYVDSELQKYPSSTSGFGRLLTHVVCYIIENIYPVSAGTLNISVAQVTILGRVSVTFPASLEVLFIRETLLTNRTRKTDLNITMLSHIVSFQVMFSFSHKIAHTTLERVYIHISVLYLVSLCTSCICFHKFFF